MDQDEGKISVWVCREEKLVSGLTKRTTCGDVIRVLLQDQNLQDGGSAALLCGSPQAYCVVEKWRGFERILPNKTKLLRLWSAWGEEQQSVRFVLVRNEASLANSGARSAEARVVQSRDGGAGNQNQEKQRRMVRKAFRKLDQINKKKEMETLVHLVVSQDHTIRQQVHRIQQLDQEIEGYESKVHLDRVQRLGANYVQDTYMLEEEKFEELARLQEELSEREALVESITEEIQEELNHRWMKRRENQQQQEEKSETDVEVEEERIKTQLDTSLYIGLKLKTDLESIRVDLDQSLELWESKEKELLELLGELEVDQEPGLCKTSNDEDSDTGLSSMHSQDSDNPPVCESLV